MKIHNISIHFLYTVYKLVVCLEVYKINNNGICNIKNWKVQNKKKKKRNAGLACTCAIIGNNNENLCFKRSDPFLQSKLIGQQLNTVTNIYRAL